MQQQSVRIQGAAQESKTGCRETYQEIKALNKVVRKSDLELEVGGKTKHKRCMISTKSTGPDKLKQMWDKKEGRIKDSINILSCCNQKNCDQLNMEEINVEEGTG